jgi:ATP-dependent DNA helicase RecG
MEFFRMPTDDNHVTNPREFMELAVETMLDSKSEDRDDKSSPLVGAVLVMADGRVEKACRGELSEGDHAEYTLLERKLASADLTGSTLFATLEPCAPGARSINKSSCAERIVNRRVTKVWVGIEDPDPLVDKRGIQYLLDRGVDVELFDSDLQESIRRANPDFISGAEERASKYEDKSVQENISLLETPILTARLNDLDTEEINTFINRVGEFKFTYDSDDFYRVFTQLRYFAINDAILYPTGLGILLFGKNPQVFFPHAVIRATFNTAAGKEGIVTFSGSLPKQAIESLNWFEKMIGRSIDRSSAQRKEIFKYPVDVIRESVINSLAHRSYDIEGASIYLEVSDSSIIIRSPGGPAKPISMDRMRKLDAPYFSRNPRITFAFEKLGLSENRGLGFKTIRSLPSEYGRPLPTATFDEPYLTFLFPRDYSKGISDERLNTLSSTEAKGFDFIRLNSPITRRAYEESLSLSTKTAERHLAHFVELNLIIRVGSGPSTSYRIVD